MVVNADFAAVIDGSTSKTPLRVNPDMSNGRYCMELIRRYILSMAADISMDAFCRGVTEYIADAYRQHGIDRERLSAHPEERLTASAVIYSSCHREVWFIGDCQCLIDGKLYDNAKPYESRLAGRRAAFIEKALASGRTTVQNILNGDDQGRASILEELVQCCKGQNKTFSVIDGFTIPLALVKVIKLAPETHEIVLASDGYPLLCPTLAASEAALRRQLNTDPLCISTYKATKGLRQGQSSFDDRSYIRFTT